MNARTTPIPVVADDRERHSLVVGRLRESVQFSLRVERLALGDYRLDNRFLFERKTLADLAGSIASGRLFSQALRLVEVDNLRPALILEGTSADWSESGMRREAVQGALVTLTMFFGLPVLRARSAEETVAILRYAAVQARVAGRTPSYRPGRRPKGKSVVQRRILQNLPGVGPERAARLLRRFGSVAAVMTADERELQAVDGIGEHVARRIKWAVREPSSVYRRSVRSETIFGHRGLAEAAGVGRAAFFQSGRTARGF